MKKILVCGAGGFIGSHLVTALKREGYWVRGVDLKLPVFSNTHADDFIIGDLRQLSICEQATDMDFAEVYQLAADMGGAGFIFTGDNDADILHNSVLINLNILACCRKRHLKRIFYSSSACIYPAYNQLDPLNPSCQEATAYPAAPDSEYGWEKLFSERLYLAYSRNNDIAVRIARYHNIFGPEGTWIGGREKAPAALCRKIAMAKEGETIEVWGDGEQTRSFLYIDECVMGTLRLMRADFAGPVNIGSTEMVSINTLSQMIMQISGKSVRIAHVPGPQGVRGRKSDNQLIQAKLNWQPSQSLFDGLKKTYDWVLDQVQRMHLSTGDVSTQQVVDAMS